MKFRHEVFPIEAQHICAQEIQTVLVDYLTGKYSALYFAVSDLISRLCLQNQVTFEGREAIRLNNNLGFLIDRWEAGLVDGRRPTEQEMQSIIGQVLPVTVQTILPSAIINEDGE